MTEMWLPVTDYPAYEISDQGRVRSLDREVDTRWDTPKSVAGKVLKPLMIGGSKQYPAVSLYRDGASKNCFIHIMVLEHFVGPRPERHYACHRDDNTSNNALENLYWGSASQNNLDAVSNGLNWKSNITECPQGHEYTPENTYVTTTGHRQCRACIKGRNKGNANADKTHCPQGHEYTPENTNVFGNRRQCKECGRDRAREYQRRRKAAAKAAKLNP